MHQVLSPIVISDRLYEERVKNNHIKNLYFDFNQYVKNFTRGQTPFTPAVGVCLEMNKALHLIEEEVLKTIYLVLIVWQKISEIELKNYQYLFLLLL